MIDGDWIETGSWLEVRSPCDSELVGRAAKGGDAEARLAVDAPERAMSTEGEGFEPSRGLHL